jgi:hypothetical protein
MVEEGIAEYFGIGEALGIIVCSPCISLENICRG